MPGKLWFPILVALALGCAGYAYAADISGVPRIVDGDTLAIGETKIRLEGIDASEADQICLSAASERWTCGLTARDQFVGHVGDRTIDCSPTGTDRYGRTLAVFGAGDEDLNAWMVREG